MGFKIFHIAMILILLVAVFLSGVAFAATPTPMALPSVTAIPAQSSTTSNEWYVKSLSLYNSGKYLEALEVINHSIEQYPENYSYCLRKAYILQALGHKDEANQSYEQAIRIFDKEIARSPESPYLYVNKGSTLINLGRYDEALQTIERAIAVDPDYAHAFYWKGIVLNYMGRNDEALEAIDTVISKEPSRSYYWSKKGMILEDLKRYDEAIQAFDKAIDLGPDDGYIWSYKGNTFYNQGKKVEALQAYYKAISIEPDSQYLWNSKARLEKELGLQAIPSMVFFYTMMLPVSGMSLASWTVLLQLGGALAAAGILYLRRR
jgi:tetratricopeptide (TPR) repeat protein